MNDAQSASDRPRAKVIPLRRKVEHVLPEGCDVAFEDAFIRIFSDELVAKLNTPERSHDDAPAIAPVSQ